MQFKEEVVTTDCTIQNHINNNNYSHNNLYNQENVRLRDIPESYYDNILTDKGILVVKVKSKTFHIYDIFSTSSDKTFNDIANVDSGMNVSNDHLENKHTLLLTLNEEGYYFIKPIICGRTQLVDNGLYKLICMIDLPKFKYNGTVYTVSDDGYYYLDDTDELSHGDIEIIQFYLPNKQYHTINPLCLTEDQKAVLIYNIHDINGTSISYSSESRQRINISENTGDIFLSINTTGNVEQFILEVW